MIEALIGIILSGMTLAVAVGVLIYARVKDRKRLRRYAGIAGIIAAVVLGLCVFSVVWQSYLYTKAFFHKRDGREVYAAFFGEPVAECVRVTGFRDAVLPVIDYEIRLEAETCPAEMRRILAQRPYYCRLEETSWMIPDSNVVLPPDFRQWGDSVCLCTLDDLSGHGRLLRFPKDSSRVYLSDY